MFDSNLAACYHSASLQMLGQFAVGTVLFFRSVMIQTDPNIDYAVFAQTCNSHAKQDKSHRLTLGITVLNVSRFFNAVAIFFSFALLLLLLNCVYTDSFSLRGRKLTSQTFSPTTPTRFLLSALQFGSCTRFTGLRDSTCCRWEGRATTFSVRLELVTSCVALDEITDIIRLACKYIRILAGVERLTV